VDCGCREFDGKGILLCVFGIIRLVHAVKFGTAFEL